MLDSGQVFKYSKIWPKLFCDKVLVEHFGGAEFAVKNLVEWTQRGISFHLAFQGEQTNKKIMIETLMVGGVGV